MASDPVVRRLPRVVGALCLLAVCALTVAVLAGQTQIVYHVGPTEPGGVAPRRTATFGPAVLGVVITGVATLLELGWTVWNAVAHPSRRWWVAATTVALLAVGVGVVVTGMARPVF